MNILLYGGSFNPIHISHLQCLNKAIEKHHFDQVLMILNYQAVHKENNNLIDSSHRYKMLELALEESNLDHIVEISSVELDAKKAMYTYDTILLLKEKYPTAKFYFLIGYDQANQLDTWYQIDKLKELVNFMIISDNNSINNKEGLDIIDGLVDKRRSTKIREEYYSTGFKSVDKYIRDNGLYLIDYLSKHLSHNRYLHSINVSNLAINLASHYKVDLNKARIAGLLHDVCKEMDLDKQYELANKSDLELLEVNDKTVHAYASKAYIKEVLNIKDEDIVNATSKHTTGHYEMSDLDKIIYVSDMLCLDRDFKGVNELRDLMYNGLDNIYNECLLKTYAHLKGHEFSEEYQNIINKIKKRG